MRATFWSTTFLSSLKPLLMARPKGSGAPEMSSGQAHYVVNRILADRAVPVSQIRRYLSELDGEISTLESRLEFLRAASGGGSSRAGSAVAGAGGRRRRNLSPERRESLRLQGHYLALIRQVPARQRAQYKAIVEKRGKEAAIAALRRAVGSK